MKVAFSDSAFEKMMDVAEFVDNINTSGAGDRWIEKLIEFIEDHAKLKHIQWSLCLNKNLAAKYYSCLIYKTWIIAFKIEANTFKVYDFIYGPLLG